MIIRQIELEEKDSKKEDGGKEVEGTLVASDGIECTSYDGSHELAEPERSLHLCHFYFYLGEENERDVGIGYTLKGSVGNPHQQSVPQADCQEQCSVLYVVHHSEYQHAYCLHQETQHYHSLSSGQVQNFAEQH